MNSRRPLYRLLFQHQSQLQNPGSVVFPAATISKHFHSDTELRLTLKLSPAVHVTSALSKSQTVWSDFLVSFHGARQVTERRSCQPRYRTQGSEEQVPSDARASDESGGKKRANLGFYFISFFILILLFSI